MISENLGRILVIDDDIDYSDGISAILTSYNYKVTQTFNIKQSITELDIFNPDVVLLDLRLGREQGIEVLNEIKSRNHHAICILITAYSSIDSAIAALRYGAYDYLQKPISPEALMNIINHCFDRLTMEKTIRKYQTNLEELVANRTSELRESKEMYKSLTKLLPVGVIKVNKDNICTFVNNKWTALTEYTFNKNSKSYDWYKSVTSSTQEVFIIEWTNFLNTYNFDDSYIFERQINNDNWISYEAIKVESGGCIITAINISKQKKILNELLLIKRGSICNVR